MILVRKILANDSINTICCNNIYQNIDWTFQFVDQLNDEIHEIGIQQILMKFTIVV